MHKPVLLNEVIECLDPKSGDIVLDGTFGGGGHSKAICDLIGKEGKIIGIDQDEGMIAKGEERIKNGDFDNCKISLINANFGEMDILQRSDLCKKKFDKILLDLGLNSEQLDNSGRGFTFQKDEPLIMTFKENSGEEDLTAARILNEWDEKDIANVIYAYGEERFSRRIAAEIVKRREEKPFKTTFELVDAIRVSVPAFYRNAARDRKGVNCCTKTFQALRIAVNDELKVLEKGLEKAWDLLKADGRLAVISFHSLEDRIVKEFFKDKVKIGQGEFLTNMPAGKAGKPVVPGEEEIKDNPRSRSAKLRVIKKI